MSAKPEDPDLITDNDRDPDNVFIRSGYLRGLAERATNEDDRLFLRRAARSLRAYAGSLVERRNDYSGPSVHCPGLRSIIDAAKAHRALCEVCRG